MNKRTITEEEFNAAYYGVKDDPESMKAAHDNRMIIRHVLNKYLKYKIPKEDLDTCGMLAMWKCLQNHNPEYGRKFTTSLHVFTDWECKRELRSIRSRLSKRVKTVSTSWGTPYLPDNEGANFINTNVFQENVEHISLYIEKLPEESQRKVLKQYYLQHKTFKEIGEENGYSGESARRNLTNALEQLKMICSEEMNVD